MAWTSGFFNSVSGDRMYNADQMSAIFEGLITDGVYESVGNKLAVQPNNGLTIQIATGRGWFGQRWVNNDSAYLLTLEDADVTLNRYCAVCIRVDLTESGRTAAPYLKYSALATSPVKPTMERSETIKEYCLAYVYIKAGATQITAANIEDTRANSDVCGWVTGLIDQVDTKTLWSQWQAQFTDWFDNLQSYLDEDAETKLVADMAALQNRVVKTTATFDGLGWNSNADGYYTQTLTVNGVTADNYIVVTPTADYKDAYTTMGCEAISQEAGKITFSCPNPDDVNMVVEVLILNV